MKSRVLCLVCLYSMIYSCSVLPMHTPKKLALLPFCYVCFHGVCCTVKDACCSVKDVSATLKHEVADLLYLTNGNILAENDRYHCQAYPFCWLKKLARPFERNR